ncbi:MAG: radical SAM family heme chaperone HemW [Candidatus Methylacidiphilales bacterium]|nr:radical SAM family heme chaperone HemW [Candidatus Methylacidiphilales bacterium]
MVRHLYVHVPFCAKVCPYCAFHVHRGGRAAQTRFVDAMLQEWRLTRARHTCSFDTIYFGGGTPSILAPEDFLRLAGELRGGLAGSSGGNEPEVTLEVNPATVTPAKAAAWRQGGVNRISLGAQSFDPAWLKLLGRQHQPRDIVESVQQLRAEGFANISIDLMFALPSQPISVWQDTLAAAVACGPDHLSAYALTYEEDTPFLEKLKRGEWTRNDEREAEMFSLTVDYLASHGLHAYEISNFARPGYESRHNRAYWLGRDYLGLGPSAVSTLGGRRWRNAPDTEAYVTALLAGDAEGNGEGQNNGDGLNASPDQPDAENSALAQAPRVEEEEISDEIRQRERIMFGLRMREGVALEDLVRLASFGAESEGGSASQSAATGVPPPEDHIVREGLAVREDGRLKLTPRGRLVADSIAELFV